MSKSGPSPTVVVVGRGPDSAQAALDMVGAGVAVTLLTADDWLTPGVDGPRGMPLLLETAGHPQVNLLTGASVETIQNGGLDLRVTVRQMPRYVDPDRCTACGACAEVCSVAIPGENGETPHKAIYRAGVPTTYAIDKIGMSPCRQACPINQRAQGYVALVRAGNFEAAYQTIKRDNPFPSICGRVCNHRCEDACSRGKEDAPVNVMGLKRFVADRVWEQRASGGLPVSGGNDKKREAAGRPERTGKKVAVVGAGPAGLTCALDLVRQGHAVTVYEALPVAGGMMRVGVPEYRLPHNLVQGEIDDILTEGVELVLNHRVEDVPGLLRNGFDAVFVAVGAHQGIKLPIPGTDLPEVLVATEFLRAVSLARGERRKATTIPEAKRSGRGESEASVDDLPADVSNLVAGRRVLVLGGGNVAVDAAMTAVRLGASWVVMTCLESREQLPAHDWEVRDAEEEGIELFPSRTFKEVISDSGHVAGVRCAEIDFRGFEDGRPDFDELPGTEEVIAADVVIFAIGQRPEIDCLRGQVEMLHGRFPVVDPETLATSLPGVFAGGDGVMGTAFVIDAIAAGHQAARSIDRYLWGQDLIVDQAHPPSVELEEAEVRRRLATGQAATVGRTEMKKRPAQERRHDFREVYTGLTEAEARAEAERCLNCGICSECLQCVEACPAGAISHERYPLSWDLSAGAVIWTDATTPPLADLPGVFAAGNGVSLTATVEQALTHLGLTRPMPTMGVAAPSRWQFASRSPVLGGFTSPSRRLREGEARNTQLGVFLCRCGGEIERAVDMSTVAARVEGLPGVMFVAQIDFACHTKGSEVIRSTWAAHDLDGAVLAACSCCALDQICYSCTTQRTRCKERLGVWDGLTSVSSPARPGREVEPKGLPLQFVNVREQCAFVHRDDPDAATLKAVDLVAASVAALSVEPGGSRVRGHESWSPITASIDLVRCRGCEDCETVCGLQAVQVVGRDDVRIAQVDAARCLGCGICMAVCSSGAIHASDTSDAQAEAMLAAIGDLSDKTVIFSCNWGAYSAVEAAGVARLNYNPSVRLIRLMCAGRAHEGLILRAFAQGAARVLVLACGYERDSSMFQGNASQSQRDASHCHYRTGNDQAQRSVEQAQRLLGLLGIDPTRLAIAEIRPDDGPRFVAVVEESVGPTTKVAL